MSAHRQTFTLIEMLVVISVIAILAGITIGGARLAFDKSEESTIKMRVKKMEMALEEYKKDWGYYPIVIWDANKDGNPDVDRNGDGVVTYMDRYLSFTLESPDGEKYLPESTTPYGQTEGGESMSYHYPGVNNTEKYDLCAPGLDEIFDTDDDITNWEER